MMIDRVVSSKWSRTAIPRLIAPLLGLACLFVSAPSSARELDFPPTDYTVRSIDGLHIIGHAHFTVTTDADGLITVHGDYRFLDGEYDNDEATLRPSSDGSLPLLVRSHHAFFHADGSPDRESRADVAAGIGSCTVYENGQPQVNRAQLDFPADTVAGDAVILPLQRFLKEGGNGSISFHDFNCIPGPKLLKVTARARDGVTVVLLSRQPYGGRCRAGLRLDQHYHRTVSATPPGMVRSGRALVLRRRPVGAVLQGFEVPDGARAQSRGRNQTGTGASAKRRQRRLAAQAPDPACSLCCRAISRQLAAMRLPIASQMIVAIRKVPCQPNFDARVDPRQPFTATQRGVSRRSIFSGDAGGHRQRAD